MGDVSAGRPGLQIFLFAVLALCGTAVGWLLLQGSRTQSGRTGSPAADEATDRVDADAAAAVQSPGAVLEGRVLLELAPVPIEPAAQIVVDAPTQSAPGERPHGLEGDPQDLDPSWAPDAIGEPPEMKTRPAEEGTCTILAWQRGERRSVPASCDAAGDYRLELAPGTEGPVAIEIEIPGRLRAVLEVDAPAGGRARVPTVAVGFAELLRGQVVDARGDPVADVVVEAMPSPNLDEPEPWRRRTDANGDYVFDTLPPGPVALRCAAGGYAPTVVEAIAPEENVILRMGALFTIRGKVLLGSAKPSAVQVRLEGSGVWPAKEIEAKSDGTFTIPAIPDGVYAIEALAPSDAPGGVDYASVPLENVTPELEITLALTRAYRLNVTVVDAAGEPIAGARARLLSSQVGLLAKTAVSDEQGRAVLGPVVVGPYVLHADADGFLPTEPLPIAVDEGNELSVTVRLAKSARIEGVVVDDGGRPVEGATVAVETDVLFTVGEGAARAQMFTGTLVAAGTLGVTRGPVPEIPLGGSADVAGPADVRTSAGGRFVISDLTPGRYRLRAMHGTFAASDEVTVPVRSGAVAADVRLVLRTGVPLTGRVRDANDRPIAGAQVRLLDGSRYETDSRGVFHAGRRHGRQELVASASGFSPTRRVVVVRERPLDVEVSLVEADAHLSGRVENDNGRPLEGARVTVQASDGLSATRVAWSDARGVWALAGLAAGRADVDILASGFLSQEKTVRLRNGGATALDTTMRAGWEAELVVLAYGSDEPVIGAAVSGGGAHGIADAEGIARLQGLGAPRITFTVSARGYPSRSIVVKQPSAGPARATVTLIDGGSLAGTLTDFRGDPVAGARVVLVDSADDEHEARSGPGGAFAFEGLPEGNVAIEAFPPAARADELAEVAHDSDVLRGRVTRGVAVRFDRR